ncbi:hypothetical protein HV356_30555 [Citrobacter sp. RHBSTW-01065]|nr:hypothetical protein [Citrobacter sp. RHBSTW-01065]
MTIALWQCSKSQNDNKRALRGSFLFKNKAKINVVVEKWSLDKFFVFLTCQPEITPYNAPPLTRNNGLQTAGSAEKGENKRLTL